MSTGIQWLDLLFLLTKPPIFRSKNILIWTIELHSLCEGTPGEWGPWGPCSKSCGAATKARSRVCNGRLSSNSFGKGQMDPGKLGSKLANNYKFCTTLKKILNHKISVFVDLKPLNNFQVLSAQIWRKLKRKIVQLWNAQVNWTEGKGYNRSLKRILIKVLVSVKQIQK